MKLKNATIYFYCLTLGVALFIFLGCKDKSQDNQDNVSKKLVLLKVDYQTHDFEGGQQIELGPHTNLADTLPLIVNYMQPSDFGSLSIYYNSSNSSNLVFDASIILDGLGNRTFPSSIIDVADFPTLGSPLADIDSTEFQLVHYELGIQQIYYDSIWDGIKNLQIVEYCRAQNDKKMALFLYQPSVGPGDPADWDWYILMEK